MVSTKTYCCKRCGCLSEQSTNHYGETWSCGRCNVCPDCPPYAKYPEYGGITRWVCVDEPKYVVEVRFAYVGDDGKGKEATWYLCYDPTAPIKPLKIQVDREKATEFKDMKEAQSRYDEFRRQSWLSPLTLGSAVVYA